MNIRRIRDKVIGRTRRTFNESDSLTLILSLWPYPRRPPIPSQIQTGRTVSAVGFYICQSAVICLFLGIGFTLLSVSSLVIKIYYSYLIDCPTELGYFTISAALLCFPCFWIAVSVHNDEKQHRFLPLLLILLCFSVMLTATATFLSFTNRLYSNFDKIIYKDNVIHEYLENMRLSVAQYKSNKHHRNAWDFVQRKMNCCGITNSSDWEMYQTIPESCCTNASCTVVKQGCLRPIILEVSQQLCLFAGLTCVGLTIQIITFIGLTAVYLMEKCKSQGMN